MYLFYDPAVDEKFRLESESEKNWSEIPKVSVVKKIKRGVECCCSIVKIHASCLLS